MTTYAEACRDPNLFGPWFEADTWGNWRVLDKALFGEPLTAEELDIFRMLTGRETAPTEQASEAWIIAGRRSGKDVKASSLAVYLATIGAELYGYRKRLTRGERGVVQILAVDRDQAAVAFRYARSFFEQPLLNPLLRRETTDSLELDNGLAIEITTSDQRRVRGRTVIAAIFDEVAHWRAEDTATPDREIYRAVKPAMLTIPNAILIGISSPHARRGLLWEKYQAHYGEAGNVLVVKAPTWVMNPNMSRDAGDIAEAYADDESWASAEYGGEFRSDVENFVSQEVVGACTDYEDFERPHHKAFSYCGFVDPSGGSRDSFTMAISHCEGGIAVLDLVREAKPPFAPSQIVEEFCGVLKGYGIRTIYGDRYAGEWPPEAFALHGITYETSEFSKSELYVALLPMLNSRTVALIDNERLRRQLLSLERRTARGGRDSVDHPRGAHDDLCNAAAGALVTARHQPGATSSPRFNRKIEYRDVEVA